MHPEIPTDKKKYIILDSDPGIDDTLAILLAMASPEIELEAITIVSGNCSVEQGVSNALGLLEMIHASHIPVYQGLCIPLIRPLLIAPETHGGSGIGYATLPQSHTRPSPQHAVDYLIETVLASPGKYTIVAIGPLTNIALAIRREPQIISAIQEIVIMGGAINVGGNTTPLAEFNTYCDPHATHIVFHAGIPLTLIPLDVTYQVILTKQDIDRLMAVPSPVSRFVRDSTRFYMEFHDEYQNIEGCVINDPLALATVFEPNLVELQDLYVNVDTSDGVSLGKTYADFYCIEKQAPNVKVALKVNAQRFLELFVQRIESLSRMFAD